MSVDRRFSFLTVLALSFLAAGLAYSQVQLQRTPSDSAIIRQVEIGTQAGATVVRVSGDGPLAPHMEQLKDPSRLVLDFANTRLGDVRLPAVRAAGPVHGVRTGQFKPDVARIVVDLDGSVPYRIETAAGSVTIAFGSTNTGPTQTPSELKPPQTPAQINTPSLKTAATTLTRDNVVRTIPAAVSSRAMPTTTPLTVAESASSSSSARPDAVPAPTSRPSGSVTATAADILPNSFQNGLLTFHAKDRPLQSVLDDIGGIADVTIIVAKDVGSEHVSADFRTYRLDEALRQILKDYDVLFSYRNSGEVNPTLRTVWVYAPNHGPGINRFAMTAWNKSDKDYEQEMTNINPDERARAVDELIRRGGRDAVNVLMQALKDPSDKVRYQALYRAVLVGAMPSEDTIIDLVLNDSSEQVRVWAFQTLPLDPTLRWVAQRAAEDSNQQIAELARNYLKDLDGSVGSDTADAPMPPSQSVTQPNQ